MKIMAARLLLLMTCTGFGAAVVADEFVADSTSVDEASISNASFNAPVNAESARIPAENRLPETQAEMAVADRVMRAIDLIGTPYRKQGNSPLRGFDCSGFIAHVFKVANNIDLPRSAREMFTAFKSAAVSREELVPGDLLFFRIGRLGRQIDHVGLYLGESRFVHAPASGGFVRIDALDATYWQQTYAGARRVPLAVTANMAALKDEFRLRGQHLQMADGAEADQ